MQRFLVPLLVRKQADRFELVVGFHGIAGRPVARPEWRESRAPEPKS
jgi:hypothetical protein